MGARESDIWAEETVFDLSPKGVSKPAMGSPEGKAPKGKDKCRGLEACPRTGGQC